MLYAWINFSKLIIYTCNIIKYFTYFTRQFVLLHIHAYFLGSCSHLGNFLVRYEVLILLISQLLASALPMSFFPSFEPARKNKVTSVLQRSSVNRLHKFTIPNLQSPQIDIPPRWNSPCRGEGAYPPRSSNQCINQWSSSERCSYVR